MECSVQMDTDKTELKFEVGVIQYVNACSVHLRLN